MLVASHTDFPFGGALGYDTGTVVPGICVATIPFRPLPSFQKRGNNWIVSILLHPIKTCLLSTKENFISAIIAHYCTSTTPASLLSFISIASSMNVFTSQQPNPYRNINCGNVSGSLSGARGYNKAAHRTQRRQSQPI